MKKFYSKHYKTQVKVGIFTIAILAALILGYLWLTSRISSHAQRDIRISFQNVMGLEVGDKALFRGMEVGRVKQIKARESGILVTAKVLRDLKLKDGTAFYVGDTSLMGGTALHIIQGDGPGYLDPDKVQTGSEPLGIMSILPAARTALDEVNSLLAELRSEQGLIDRSGQLLDSADTAVRSIDQLASDMRSEVSATLLKIDHLTAEVNQIVSSNSGNVNELLSGAPAAMANISSTLDSLQALSGRLGETVRALNSGQGTAGKLMRDQELYDRLVKSVAGLDSLVTDIQANPKKYVKFSLF